MTVKELINKLNEYNFEAEINVVVGGYAKPYTICFGGAEGVTKANCEAVDLMVDDISDEVSRNEYWCKKARNT